MKLTLIFLLSSFLLNANDYKINKTKEAIVKIYISSKIPNYQIPWNSSIINSTGSGVIIEGNRILTNAHVIANNTFIEVERYGQRKRYLANVIAVSHQSDLALLEVKEISFFEGVTPIEIGNLPEIEESKPLCPL